MCHPGRLSAVVITAAIGCACFLPNASIAGSLGPSHGGLSGPPADAPTFELPDNLPAIEERYELTDEAKAALEANGFVILPDFDEPRLSSAYFAMFGDDRVSVFITTDVALHLFHNVFDGLVAEVEREHLHGDVTAMASMLFANAQLALASMPEDQPLCRQAGLHNLVVFAVGWRLADPEASIPEEPAIEEEVDEYVAKILEHSATEFYPGDDYTIYEPRGHYAGDEELERYFRAMKWLGRRIYRIEDSHYPDQADVELVAGAMLAQLIADDEETGKLWSRVYDSTRMLAGPADSITPVLMKQALDSVFGAGFELSLLEEESNREALRTELAKDTYPESEIIPVPLAFPDQIPPKYLQLMGERYLPDAHLMHKTTFPDVPRRLLPSGLDVMAAVLGSDRALQWLDKDLARHPELAGQIAEQRALYDGYGQEWWTKSVYNSWLYSLRPVSEPVPASAPAFARGQAWQDKELNTALGSWTQARHDMILYGKQTMVPAPYAEGPGLVEPVPETFERLAAVCAQVEDELGSREMLPEDYGAALADLRGHLTSWATHADKVARGEALTSEEQRFIHQTGLWLLSLFAEYKGIPEKSPLLVADVASDSNTGRVLHEGTGHFKPLIIVYTPPGGKPLGGIGFAFDHYEFVEPDWNRLNDQEWSDRLESDPPEHPPWVSMIMPPLPGRDSWLLHLPILRRGW